MRSEEFWEWYERWAAPRLDGLVEPGEVILPRAKTFRRMFEHLDRLNRPVHIVETGCVEEPDNWSGNGCSTILFSRYADTHFGSIVRSVDIDRGKVLAASRLLPEVKFKCGDSVEAMRGWAREDRPVDLVYLDASHLDWQHPVPSALHHLNELMAILLALRPDSMVVVDDAPAVMDEFPRLEVGGKGEMVARYAFSVGADLEFLDYQAGWTNMTARPTREPETIESLIFRARRHVEEDRLVAADPLYRLILSLTLPPWRGAARVARGEACAFFARIAMSRGRYLAAASWYQEALRADPAAVDYRLDLATKCYLRLGLTDLAAAEADRATRIDPTSALAWRTLGAVEHERRDAGRAVVALDRALAASTTDEERAEAALFRATVALDSADYGLVRDLCGLAAGTRHEPDATHVLAMVAYRESRHEEAADLFDRAIADGCHDPHIAHWHKSMALEAVGIWPEAWGEREYRAGARGRPELALPMVRFEAPPWSGEPPPARIHVHAEAGAGDNLCLVRYLPLLVERGYEVCYETRDDLVGLVSGSMPGVEVVPRATDYPGALGLRPFDYHLPVGRLQNAFRTTLDSVPWNGPYLKAAPDLVMKYRRLLPRTQRKIGLCWSSGIRLKESVWLSEYGRRKSMSLAMMIGGRYLGDDLFVSLQVGPERREAVLPIIDLLPEQPTWADTAALVECLDLVITVDTAVAHLAGAMGKPVWVMCQRDAASWHFMCWRPGAPWNERSPWYPSARVFRQHEFNQPHYWDEVAADVAEALRGERALEAAE